MLPQINKNSQHLLNQLQKQHKNILNFLFTTNYQTLYLNFQQKHAPYLENIQLSQFSLYKQLEMKKFYLDISQRIHNKLQKDDIMSDKNLHRIESFWQYKGVAYFHRYYFLKYLCNSVMNKIPNYLLKQQMLMKDQNHIYFKIQRAILARQSCLEITKQQIYDINKKDMNIYFQLQQQRRELIKFQKQKRLSQNSQSEQEPSDYSGPATLQSKIQRFSINFEHLKRLTIYIINLIINWRQYLFELPLDPRRKQDNIFYYYNQQNYLLKILIDLNFMKQTILAKYYEFTINDPFLLNPILHFQKYQTLTYSQQRLKKLIFPKNDKQLRQIMVSLKILCHQYYMNIQRRKVYDLSLKNSSVDKKKQKQMIQIFKNSKLKKLDTKKNIQAAIKFSKPNNYRSLKNLRKIPKIDQQTRKSQQKKNKNELQESKLEEVKRKDLKKIKLIKLQQGYGSKGKKSIVSSSQSPQNIRSNDRPFRISKLRESIVVKMKQEIKLIKPEFKEQNNLQQMIDSQMRQIQIQIFNPKIMEQSINKSIQIKNYNIKIQFKTIRNDYLVDFIQQTFQKYPQLYQKTQIQLKQITSFALNAHLLFILQAKVNNDKIGYAFCTFDQKDLSYKRIIIKHIMAFNISMLQQFILETVHFLWQNEDCFDVQFSALKLLNFPVLVDFIQTLNQKLKNKCIIGSRQIYSNLIEFKYGFRRQGKNNKYVQNRNANKIYINLFIVYSKQGLQLQSEYEISNTVYEFMIGEIIRKYLTVQNINYLKQISNWKNRLKKVMQFVKLIQTGQILIQNQQEYSSFSMAQINLKLKQNHQKMIQIADSKKINQIKLIHHPFILSFSYNFQITQIQNIQYYRINILNKISQIKTTSSLGYFIPLSNANIQLFVLQAQQFINLQTNLFLYLHKILKQNQKQIVYIDNIWIPMFGRKQQSNQKRAIYLQPTRLYQFSTLKKNLYFAQEIQFFLNTNLGNSIKFSSAQNDMIMKLPFVFAILEKGFPIYAKCII